MVHGVWLYVYMVYGCIVYVYVVYGVCSLEYMVYGVKLHVYMVYAHLIWVQSRREYQDYVLSTSLVFTSYSFSISVAMQYQTTYDSFGTGTNID